MTAVEAIDLDAIEEHLRACVLEAGRIAMEAFGQGRRSWHKAPGQILTETDLAIDRALRSSLGEGPLADAAWLSEESADDGERLGTRFVWVVDPIDGTRSFAEGKPEFTISVALVENGRPVLASLLNPATSEHFEARRGGGATLNARPLEPPAARDGPPRIVLSANENRRRAFDRLFPDAVVSTVGSLALKMALVACGRFDAYFSWRRAHDWDVAAALLVLEEAGRIATDREGLPIRLNRPMAEHWGMIAAGPELHSRLIAVSRRALPAEV